MSATGDAWVVLHSMVFCENGDDLRNLSEILYASTSTWNR